MPDPSAFKTSVRPVERGFTGVCVGPAGRCFRTRGWPTERIAELRMEQHKIEHATGVTMPPVSQFRDRVGMR